ncbi:TRAP transporter small permease [Sporosarcina sp. P13]|uniref:TRAP transporter small permease n=1 Tax=Sporosarcina sp. P13 TaxID=2048263 RepID=UPI0013047882
MSLLLQIYFRYAVGKSLPWTEELSRFAFLFLVFMVISISVKRHSHIRVTVQFRMFSPRVQSILMVISDLIWFAFNCVVIYTGLKLFMDMGASNRTQISPVLGWNLKYVYAILPIGFLLMNIRMIQNYCLSYLDKKNQRGNVNVS